MDLDLTASNPGDYPHVSFTLNDLRRGLHIPEPGGEAYVLGLMYSFAYIFNYPEIPELCFLGREEDEKLFGRIRSKVEDIYNIKAKVENWKAPPSEWTVGGRKVTFDEHEVSRIRYYSRGLCTHLREDYGFPTNKREIKGARVPRRIRESAPNTQRNFLRGVFNKAVLYKEGRLYYSNKSKGFLKDVKDMMTNLGIPTPLSIRKRRGGGSYRLRASQPPTRHAVEEGIIEKHP
ncbi:MAG: hypothetical protein GWO20_15845 [Candidatus Korarchaeota archaeon]|nr:hypothetical protein [Candidatus Korarchaeota archaeon]NIU84944.1 hypothetical protein [Candidatus Thorarchaeota archaeon]NIW14961.1 hypothetical protein [Candidatus Thorarchaeota archaeon]NIW52928.1 hypothetical protein [Candidatus Korarchaeota archaeon]